jgi:hypothetical protein
MESLFSIFLLFVAAIVAVMTYVFVKSMSVVALTSAAAIALAAGVWWHWTQFSIDYRTSTWQEQLRNYASYVMVLVVVLLSYGFYVFAFSGSALQGYAASAINTVRDSAYTVTSTIAEGTTKVATNLISEPVAPNRQTNRNRSANILI